MIRCRLFCLMFAFTAVAASENSDMPLFTVFAQYVYSSLYASAKLELLLFAVFAASENAEMLLVTVLAASENAELQLFYSI